MKIETRETLLRMYFGINAPVTDELPASMLKRVRDPRTGRVRPATVLSIPVTAVGGRQGYDCAIARGAEKAGHRVLVGARVGYAVLRLPHDPDLPKARRGRQVIVKLAHNGTDLVLTNDKERKLERPAVIDFYGLTPGRTRRAAAARRRRGVARPYTRQLIPRVSGRNLDVSLLEWASKFGHYRATTAA